MHGNRYEKSLLKALLLFFILFFLFIFSEFYIGHLNKRYSNEFHGGYKVIDTEGKNVIDESFFDITDFNSNGVAFYIHKWTIAGLTDEMGFIDGEGNSVYEEATKTIKDLKIDSAKIIPYLGDEVLIADDGTNVDIIDLDTGDFYIVENATMSFDDYSFENGFFALIDKETDKVGYVNKYGEWVIKPEFGDLSRQFHEGLASVQIDGLFGFIDTNGNIVVEPQYSDAYSFSEGYAVIDRDGLWGYIDKTGKVVVEPIYRRADNFHEGLACVVDNESNRSGFIDTDGNVVIDFQYKEAGSFHEGLAYVKDEESKLYGYIDTKGNLVIPYKFNYGEDFSEDGIALVYTDVGGGYIDTEEKWILNPQDILGDFKGYNNGYAAIRLPYGEYIHYDISDNVQWKIDYNKKAEFKHNIFCLYENNSIRYRVALVVGAVLIIYIIFLMFMCMKEDMKQSEKI